MIVKGNEVRSNRNGKDGLVLAVRKDGTFVKVYVYGSDGIETWVKPEHVTVTVNGDDTCWKCGGSGLFYMGGGTVNGKYTGQTGPCYGCEGKGVQNNGDRLRNHGYHHRRAEVEERVAAAERGEEVKPLSASHNPVLKPKANIAKARAKKTVKTVHGERSTTPATDAANWRDELDDLLIDCKGCGTTHRNDTLCPW